MTSPLATSPPPLPRPSAPEAPEPDYLSFAWEDLSGIAREILPLFKRHWEELEEDKEGAPFEPDWDGLFACQLQRLLHVLTVRSDGVLVGYAFLFLQPNVMSVGRYRAFTERFWLDPDFRQGWLGVRLLREPEKKARALGATRLAASPTLRFAKDRGSLSKVFERLGYQPEDLVMVKTLE